MPRENDELELEIGALYLLSPEHAEGEELLVTVTGVTNKSVTYEYQTEGEEGDESSDDFEPEYFAGKLSIPDFVKRAQLLETSDEVAAAEAEFDEEDY